MCIVGPLITIGRPEYTPINPTSGPSEMGNLNIKLFTNSLDSETMIKQADIGYFTWQIVPLVPVQVLGGLSMM